MQRLAALWRAVELEALMAVSPRRSLWVTSAPRAALAQRFRYSFHHGTGFVTRG